MLLVCAVRLSVRLSGLSFSLFAPQADKSFRVQLAAGRFTTIPVPTDVQVLVGLAVVGVLYLD